MSSSPKTSKEEKEKWWNEWPLEGPQDRPAVFITKILSKSTLLIGWDDERIERNAMQALSEATGKEVKDLSNLSEFHFGPKKEEIDKVSFGLLGIVSKKIADKFLNLEVEQDDGENRKKTLREIGGSVFDEDVESGTVRDTELYKLALRNLQWQRDNYLVGRKYADKRKHERRLSQSLSLEMEEETLEVGPSQFQIPFDPSAYGHIQLVQLASWFIPSPVVHNSLLPLVTILPSGPLHQPILRATADLIPLSQGNLDSVVKSQLLWVLDNQEWRDVIKSNTKGYISNTYVETPKRA